MQRSRRARAPSLDATRPDARPSGATPRRAPALRGDARRGDAALGQTARQSRRPPISPGPSRWSPCFCASRRPGFATVLAGWPNARDSRKPSRVFFPHNADPRLFTVSQGSSARLQDSRGTGCVSSTVEDSHDRWQLRPDAPAPGRAVVPVDAVPRRVQRQRLQDRRHVPDDRALRGARRPGSGATSARRPAAHSSARSSSCRSCCSPATPVTSRTR